MNPQSLREAAFVTWEAYLHQPYRWGGDDPLAGVDCSGLALEGLKSVGLFPRSADVTAHDLLHATYKNLIRITDPLSLRRGMLVFWPSSSGRIRHVEIVWAVIGETVLTIGASGGGSRTVDRASATAQNAYVKIRRITPGWVAAVDPFDGG